MDFDHTLKHCGSFGRFQVIILLLFGYTNILSSLHYFSQTLITITPEHWCYHKKLEGLNSVDLRLAYSNVSDSSCTLLEDVVNGTGIATEDACSRWIFDRERGYESIITELNWVCEESYQPAVGQSFFSVGSVVGTITFGYLSDKIGRMPVMLVTTLAGALGDFISSFVHTLPWFAFSRFVSGLSTDTMYYLMYILVFEYLSPKRRTFGLNIILAIFYCFGLMTSPWAAMWIGNWRKYLWLASLPALGVLFYPLLICESAQWLLTKKKYDQAVKCLKRVAKLNGRVVDDSIFDEFVKHYREKMNEEEKISNKTDTFIGMFKTQRLRRFTLTLLLKTVIVLLSYDVTYRYIEGLGTSPFELFSYSSIVYIPSGLTILLLQNVIGRKGMACASFLVGGIITTTTGFLIAYLDPKENAVLLAVMVALCRYGSTCALDAEMQYAAEMIPTSVRGQAISNIHVVGLASTSLVFYIIYLARYYQPLPLIFISVLMFFGAALCLSLPETLNKKLPETLADGEKFAINEKWYYFPCSFKDPLTTDENCSY